MVMFSGRAREKLVDGAARIASGLTEPEEFDTSLAPRIAVEAARNVGLQLRWAREGGRVLYCPLCGRGPFTPKGYYLHLLRVHPLEILRMLEDELERLSSVSRRRG